MITEGVMNVFFSMLSGLFTLLPDISWDVNQGVFTSFLEVIRFACYLLPMGTVVAILGLIVSFTMFRVIVSLIKTIWGLLPFA